MSDEHRFAACTFSHFHGIEELHRSQTGAVYSAYFKYDGKRYVLKERKLPELGRSKDIMNEVVLLRQLSHPNVVRCEGFFRDSSRRSLFIVLEYCGGGDLYRLLKGLRQSGTHMSEAMIWHIFYQLCDGLKHLHENGIVHRDIKTMNVMCINDGEVVKLADLGVSRQLSEETLMLNTFYGTPLYLSPELVENKPYNEKTDIWSLGVILYEMAALVTPFKGATLMELGRSVMSAKYEPIPRQYSSNLSKCIRWMLNPDMMLRPNIVQLLKFVGLRKEEAGDALAGPGAGSRGALSGPGGRVESNVDRIEAEVFGSSGQGARKVAPASSSSSSSSPSPAVAAGAASQQAGDDTDEEEEAEERPIAATKRKANLASSGPAPGPGPGPSSPPSAAAQPSLNFAQPVPAAPRPKAAVPTLSTAALALAQQQQQQEEEKEKGEKSSRQELESRFGHRLDPSKYSPRRQGSGQPAPHPAVAFAPASLLAGAPAAGVGGWKSDGSSMPAAGDAADQNGLFAGGVPTSARRHVAGPPSRAGDVLSDEARPVGKQGPAKEERSELLRQAPVPAPVPAPVQVVGKREADVAPAQPATDLPIPAPTRVPASAAVAAAAPTEAQAPTPAGQGQVLVAVSAERIHRALRRENASLRRLLQSRDYASASEPQPTPEEAGNVRSGKKNRPRQRPQESVVDTKLRFARAKISFLEQALSSGLVDSTAPEAAGLFAPRDRGLDEASAPLSRVATPVSTWAESGLEAAAARPPSQPSDAPRRPVRSLGQQQSLALGVQEDRFCTEELLVAPGARLPQPQPASKNGAEDKGRRGNAAVNQAAASESPQNSSSAPQPAFDFKAGKRAATASASAGAREGARAGRPGPINPLIVKEPVDEAQHPPLKQVIANDRGPLLLPLVEADYRQHIETRPRAHTPRQLGKEGPGPGSPPSSPRALKAAKAHVRFRSRPHSAIVDSNARDAGRARSPSPVSAQPRPQPQPQPQPQLKVVPLAGMYPVAGLQLAGLERLNREAYASRERLPPVVAEPDAEAAATFFQDLALNSNHPRRFHRRALVSSGDAHRGDSAKRQHAKPVNERIRALLTSDDHDRSGQHALDED